ncbi:MAG: glutamate-5-semialdehyde dehydrogenase [Candidatus Omnitrophota bacterium]
MGTFKKEEILKIAQLAKAASFCMSQLSTKTKDEALIRMSGALVENCENILRENTKDLVLARKQKLARSFIDRLTLNRERINKMAHSIGELVKLPDPVGGVIKEWTSPINGLLIKKVRVPIGVVAIIYESRPDVTSDCIGLCMKSGNCVILRGGSESYYSNQIICKVLNEAATDVIPPGAINMIPQKERQSIDVLLKLNDYIDLVIPRGGEGLIKKVTSISRIPVIKHYKGICHVYVDSDANLEMAENICLNAKVERPGVCNAMESMLVHKEIAKKFLPVMLERFRIAGVEIRGCKETAKIVKWVKLASGDDFRTEYLDLILSVKVVDNLDEAVSHINKYGTHHSDSIISENKETAQKFLERVDSACVYHNASTRFTDGYQFGMGAEMGISTDKIHCRGPMALEELTSYKYIVYGKGQVRK